MNCYFSAILIIALCCACSSEELAPKVSDNETYFPPTATSDWETQSAHQLGWDLSNIEGLYTYLEDNNSRAFIVLKDGKIVIEKYWGRNINNQSNFDSNSQWYWASAGKAITAMLVGIAQQEGKLNIDDMTSQYLGKQWTSMPEEKEKLITIRHQLSMTTGLTYQDIDLDCTAPACLSYETDAGDQWYYHNAPYTLLSAVVENATGMGFSFYTKEKLSSLIGMKGQWLSIGSNQVYWSTARDMARFGLLVLNKGIWNTKTILNDTNYYNQMLSSSQSMNPSYGFLWWLNGKAALMAPGLSSTFSVQLSEAAPSDLVAAMGKDGQFIDIVPSQNLVVIRMGDLPEGGLVPLTFHDEMWKRINLILSE